MVFLSGNESMYTLFIVCVYLYSQRGGFIVELFTMAIKLSFERSSVFGEITPKRKKQVGNV